MKKIYQHPETDIVTIAFGTHLLAGSGGVTDGGTLGDDYSEGDNTYSRKRLDLWDEEN